MAYLGAWWHLGCTEGPAEVRRVVVDVRLQVQGHTAHRQGGGADGVSELSVSVVSF
jgi:hypothetical protein